MPISSRSAKLSSPNAKVQDVPNKPTLGTPVQNGDVVEVPFTPASTGGRAAIYRAVSNPGNIEAVSYGSSPISVAGLTGNTAYTFTVRGETSAGATSGYTDASSIITPSFGAMDLISSVILTAGQPSVVFDVSTLASTYKHLQLRIVGRTDRTASGGDYIRLRFNADTGTNYSFHSLTGNGSNVVSENAVNATAMHFERLGSSDLATSNYGALVVDMLDLFSTTKYKTTRNFGGVATNYVMLQSGNWRSTSAVTAVNVVVGGGSNFVAGSRFSLYGIKG